MTAAYITDREIASTLGRKVLWFRSHRKALEQEGFPRRDKLIGLTLRADVDAWLARRRVVADPVDTPTEAHHTTTNEALHEL